MAAALAAAALMVMKTLFRRKLDNCSLSLSLLAIQEHRSQLDPNANSLSSVRSRLKCNLSPTTVSAFLGGTIPDGMSS
jgi:hypothetical protein